MTRGYSGAPLLIGLTLAVACAPRGRSLETAGVPTAGRLDGQGAVVLGWAREQRDGWEVVELQVDRGRQQLEELGGPATLRLEPGRHELRLELSHRGEARYRLRPVRLVVAEEEVRLCVLQLVGEPRRPALRCSHYLGPRRRPRRRRSARQSELASRLGEVVARLDRIERRLDHLDQQPAVESPERARVGTQLELDTSFPWEPSEPQHPPFERFDRRFDWEEPPANQ